MLWSFREWLTKPVLDVLSQMEDRMSNNIDEGLGRLSDAQLAVVGELEELRDELNDPNRPGAATDEQMAKLNGVIDALNSAASGSSTPADPSTGGDAPADPSQQF